MKKIIHLMSALLMFAGTLYGQEGIKVVRLEFDNSKLTISYDISASDGSDIYYVWLEIGKKKTGEKLVPKTLRGDIGEKIKGGNGKLIEWIPADDSLILDEEIELEIKAEKYEKSFNKGRSVLLSAVLPGLGQTKISGGKPWWLTGIAAYGLLAGGLILNKGAENDYDKYLELKQDADARAKMYSQAQQKMNLAGTFIISGAAIWATNIIWISSVPNKYKALKHLSIKTEPSYNVNYTLISYKINF